MRGAEGSEVGRNAKGLSRGKDGSTGKFIGQRATDQAASGQVPSRDGRRVGQLNIGGAHGHGAAQDLGDRDLEARLD